MSKRKVTLELIGDKEVKMNIEGEISIEEMLDMIHTAEYETLTTFDAHVKKEKGKDLKEELYKRSVLGYSLMIDKFYPEGKNNRFAGLTEKAVMKAQNDILKAQAEKK